MNMAGEKILVVDDARNIRETFTTAFDEYNIITASDGKEAMGILNRPNDIDLIVLDVMMPDISGLELLRQIRRVNKYCKVVIMTGYSSKDVVLEALRSNADDYIEKPFDVNNVKEMFERLLRESGSLSNNGADNKTDKIRLAQRLIKRNYNRRLSLQDISKEVFLSYKYLSRVFKEKTGKTFNEYKLELKISSAKQFLREGNYPLGQIAYMVGYQNPDSFMKMFKRVTGLTPSEYRSRGQKKPAVNPKKENKDGC